jgi:two-component system, OmpR family, sensor histidine kinase MtrB
MRLQTPASWFRGWRSRLGLRSRATLAFALGAFLVSSALALVTYQVTRVKFVEQRKRVYIGLAELHAKAVESDIVQEARAQAAIAKLGLQYEAYSVGAQDVSRKCPPWSAVFDVRDDPQQPQQTSSCSVITTTPESVTASERALMKLVMAGRTGYVIDQINGQATLVVGVPLRGDANELLAGYFERVPFRDEQQFLRDLARALGLAATIATLLGAGFGRVVSVRIMRPLRDVANAARELSSGNLDTRIQVKPDTDLDPLVGSFNGMAESLQLRLEREARFASDVSHELRTPLTSLTAAVQLLSARREEMPERALPALDVLTTQTEHFRQLVLDLLEISRFDAGAAELNLTDVDLPELVRQLSVPFNGVDVRSSLEESLVRLDKRRVERIVVNLLQNAQNYAGGATLVTVFEHPDNPKEKGGVDTVARRVVLWVDDAGPGIAEAEQKLVFERFRRGTAQRTSGTKGTGLGLSLVSEHARLHGGKVSVGTSPVGGARFIVELQAGDDKWDEE